MLIFPTHAWTIEYFSERLQNQIYNLPDTILGDYLRLLDILEVHGADLRMPHSKALGDRLFELRPSGEESAGRVSYCALKGKKIVMLHWFVKKTQRTPLQELRIARKRLNEIQKHG